MVKLGIISHYCRVCVSISVINCTLHHQWRGGNTKGEGWYPPLSLPLPSSGGSKVEGWFSRPCRLHYQVSSKRGGWHPLMGFCKSGWYPPLSIRGVQKGGAPLKINQNNLLENLKQRKSQKLNPY